MKILILLLILVSCTHSRITLTGKNKDNVDQKVTLEEGSILYLFPVYEACKYSTEWGIKNCYPISGETYYSVVYGLSMKLNMDRLNALAEKIDPAKKKQSEPFIFDGVTILE